MRSAATLAMLLATGCHGQFVLTGDEGDASNSCAPALTAGDPLWHDGHHNPGTDCLSCHTGQDPAAPAFSVAGTLYSDTAGTTPVAGAAITLHGADGADVVLYSGDNGNFWSVDPIAMPLLTHASACPSTAPMVSPVSNGSCNAGSCHVAGFRVYLEASP